MPFYDAKKTIKIIPNIYCFCILKMNSTLNDSSCSSSHIPPWESDHPSFPLKSWQAWTASHFHIALYIGTGYLALIHFLQRYMKSRPAFELKTPLVMWNGALAICSIIGFIETAPPLYYSLTTFGLGRIVCFEDNFNVTSAVWALITVFSKVVELGDTVFLVLRKRRVIFLHWYHHITVLLYSWYTFQYYEPIGKIFFVVNLGIHGLMYSYFAAKALDIQVPKFFAMLITGIQLTQMVLGIAVNIYTGSVKAKGQPCMREWNSLSISMGIYVTYGYLFYRFFQNSYIKGGKTFAKSRKCKSG